MDSQLLTVTITALKQICVNTKFTFISTTAKKSNLQNKKLCCYKNAQS